MFKFDGVYGAACVCIALSVLFHFLSPLFGGLNGETQTLLVGGALWFAVMIGLQREWRWLAYIAFIYCLVGSIVAFAGAYGPSTVPSWLFVLILMVDFLAGMFLFKSLWGSKKLS